MAAEGEYGNVLKTDHLSKWTVTYPVQEKKKNKKLPMWTLL